MRSLFATTIPQDPWRATRPFGMADLVIDIAEADDPTDRPAQSIAMSVIGRHAPSPDGFVADENDQPEPLVRLVVQR